MNKKNNFILVISIIVNIILIGYIVQFMNNNTIDNKQENSKLEFEEIDIPEPPEPNLEFEEMNISIVENMDTIEDLNIEEPPEPI